MHELKNKIAYQASNYFNCEIKPSNIVAEPVIIRQGYSKKILYNVIIYDNLLNVLMVGDTGTYREAFSNLSKKLRDKQKRNI